MPEFTMPPDTEPPTVSMPKAVEPPVALMAPAFTDAAGDGSVLNDHADAGVGAGYVMEPVLALVMPFEVTAAPVVTEIPAALLVPWAVIALGYR